MQNNKHCIRITNISKHYGSVCAIADGFSCNIPSAENTTLLGRNGAGKTTLMNLITNNLFLNNGTITINGTNCSVPEARKGLRYLPDSLEMPATFTAKELLKEHLFYSGDYSLEDFNETATAFDCLHLSEQPMGGRSKGQKRLLMLAIVLSGNPSLILLDEPMEGLDPVNVRIVRKRISTLVNQGCTVLQSSHRIHEAERQGGRYLIMHDGRLCLEGNMEDISFMGRIPTDSYHEGIGEMARIICEIDDYFLVEAKDHKKDWAFQSRDRISPATLEDMYIASLENR